MRSEYNQGKILIEQVSQSIQSWLAHLKHGDTWRLQQQIIAATDIYFPRANEEVEKEQATPVAARRFVEQQP